MIGGSQTSLEGSSGDLAGDDPSQFRQEDHQRCDVNYFVIRRDIPC